MNEYTTLTDLINEYRALSEIDVDSEVGTDIWNNLTDELDRLARLPLMKEQNDF